MPRKPLEVRFPDLAQYLVMCSACQRVGRDAHVDWDNFRPRGYGPWITEEVAHWHAILPLDARGFCHACASGERIAHDRLRRL
jgi:hypothetical protein